MKKYAVITLYKGKVDFLKNIYGYNKSVDKILFIIEDNIDTIRNLKKSDFEFYICEV